MSNLTPKQIQWYDSVLAKFLQPGNSWRGLSGLTTVAVKLGISADQVLADAHEAGKVNRDADLLRSMATAQAKLGTDSARVYYATKARPQNKPRRTTVRVFIQAGGTTATESDLAALSPVPVTGLSDSEQTAVFLAALWKPDDLLFIATKGATTARPGDNLRTRDEWLDRLNRGLALPGDLVTPNPLTGEPDESGSYAKLACIKSRPFAVFEIDELPAPEQLAFWRGFLARSKLAARLASIVFSGGRSYHGLLRIDADKLTYPAIRRDLLDAFATDEPPYTIDTQALNPITKTRIAGALRMDESGRRTETRQALLYLNPNA